MINHNKLCERIANIAEAKGWHSWKEKHFVSKGKTLVPDLVLAKGSKAWIIDVTIIFEQDDDCLKKAAIRKEQKYMPLIETVSGWLMSKKVRFCGFPMGARGKWYPPNTKLLSDLGLSKIEVLKMSKCFSKVAMCGSLRTYKVHGMACKP